MKPPKTRDKRRTASGVRKIGLFVLCLLPFAFALSCGSAPPADLRTLAPAETLVYLETDDLGKTLNSLTESSAFQELAKNKTDFSALDKIQVAVAVTGFEASENQVTAE